MTPTLTHEQQLLDALPMTIYTIDLEGRITFVNRPGSRFAHPHGAPQLCDEGAEVGASLRKSIVDPAVGAQLEQAMGTVREGRASSLRWEVPHGASGERCVLLQVTALADGPAITGYTVSTVDITASQRSREALIDAGFAFARSITVDRVLTEASQQLRRALACDAVAIALSDESGALRLAHQTGFTEPAEALERRLSPAWLDAEATRTATSVVTTAGIETTVPMASSEGTVIGAVTLQAAEPPALHDHAHMRRMLATIAAHAAAAIERAWLVQRTSHRRRIEAIGEVSAGVAHELRHPLFGISSAAQLLRFRVNDDPVVEKNVGRILREVERLNSMVTALLEFGQPHPIALAEGDPDLVWDDVLESQRGRLESRAQLLQRVRVGPPVRCRIDAQQLAQALGNLLVNASDAAPEGTDLTLQSSVLPNGSWRCRLHNSGPPLSPDVLPRAFEMFFSTKPGGAGIGLALCQRIIDEHGGTIALESAQGAGTSAIIVLPCVT